MDPVTLLGIIGFVVTQTYLILRTMNNAKAKADEATAASEAAAASAKEAATRQQDAMTAQFTVFSNENRRLQSRVDTLEAAQVAMATTAAAQEKELRATQHTAELAQAAHQAAVEKATTLECEVQELRGKVMALESERTTRANDLARETDRAAKLEREVTDLRARVARLEGENSALHKVIEKLNVVSVKHTPDDDPPPGGAPVAMHTTTTKQTLETSVKTEDAA
jgi:chromosome segregation ATPase